jgi:O-antigen/teichoic acid export membrane protein
MVTRFLKDSSIYAVAGMLSQGIAFLLFPFFAHVLHPREYGALDILFLVGIVVSLTVALEISQGLGRYQHDARDERERGSYAFTALLFTLGCFSVFTVVTLALAAPLSRALLGPGFGPGLLRLAALGWFVNGFLYIASDQLRWRLRPKAFAAVTVTVAVTTTAASAALVLGLRTGVSGAIAGQLIGFACGALLTAILSRGIYSPEFDWVKCRRMLRYSIPLIPSSVGVFLNGYADRLAIQHQASLAQVGVYGIGYRFAVAVGLVLVGFQGATMPLVLSQHEDPSMPTYLGRVFRVFCVLALATFVAVSVLAPPAVRVLAAPAYFAAAGVVPYVVGGALLGGMNVFAPGPIIARRTATMSAIWIAAGTLNAGLAFALVPPLGIVGAGLATLLSSALAFGSLMIVSQREYRVPHLWGRVAAATLLAVALVVLSRTAIPTGASSALAVGALLARIALLAVALAVLPWLLLDSGERAQGWRTLFARRRWRRAAGVRSGETA